MDGAGGGGSSCRMLIVGKGNVALSNLRKPRVAVWILRVHTPMSVFALIQCLYPGSHVYALVPMSSF